MVKSISHLASFLLGVLATVCAMADRDIYVFLILLSALPWAKIAAFVSPAIVDLATWREERKFERESMAVLVRRD